MISMDYASTNLGKFVPIRKVHLYTMRQQLVTRMTRKFPLLPALSTMMRSRRLVVIAGSAKSRSAGTFLDFVFDFKIGSLSHGFTTFRECLVDVETYPINRDSSWIGNDTKIVIPVKHRD
jgi:hypothetical protein